MQAQLKNGVWIEIDTAALFNNQYNTTDGRRIFDKDIKAIRDDARAGLGKCRYCGAIVKRGEEEKHFSEREARSCAGCFWYRDKIISSETKTEKETTPGENGERITRTIKTTVERLEKKCTYAERGYCKADCTNKECRAYGIEWFTPENTFFLKYPGGFDSIPEVDKLETRGFDVSPVRLNAVYKSKLGSYHLEAVLKYEDGKPVGILHYIVWNCRRSYVFRYENGELFVDKYHDGWRQEKTLDGVPANIMQSIKKICNH